MRRPTTRVLAPVAAAALLAAVGCSGSAEGDPTPVVRTAGEDSGSSSDAAASSSSAQAEPDEDQVPSPAAPSGEEVDGGELVASMAAASEQAGTVAVDAALQLDPARQASADGTQDVGLNAGDERLDMTVDLVGQELRFRLVDQTYYLAQGSKWVEVDLAGGPQTTRDLVAQLQPLNLRSLLDALAEGSPQATKEGEEMIDGEKTRRYSMTADSAALAEAFGSTATPKEEKTLYNLWLDEQDRPKRINLLLDQGPLLITLSDWGDEVSIKAPAPSQITTG